MKIITDEIVAAMLLELRRRPFGEALELLSSHWQPVRRPGRPPRVATAPNSLSGAVKAVADAPAPKRRGRPPGSKNRQAL